MNDLPDVLRPTAKGGKDAILKVKEYAEQGYTFAVVLDLSKYFDTLNHEKMCIRDSIICVLDNTSFWWEIYYRYNKYIY